MQAAPDLALLHRWSRIATALAVAAVFATAGLLGFGAQRAEAQPTASDWYTVQSRHSGLALDIQGVSTEPGAILTQYTNWANTNQQFRFIDVGNGYHKIQVRHSGLFLDVWNHSTADGGTVAQYHDTGDTNQQWKVTANGEGYYSIVSRFSGKALDVRDWSTTAGSPIVQHSVSGYANQQWQLTPVGSTCGADTVLADIRQDSNA
ncbi:RICIN domain-containing protein [Glycomyces tritici]|uniref:RICIN domain-containing protein n=1 Tax=Glycomyces tritici TaxID=2665176 RepID=A0ABT7YRQ6_9ACTN|nr:RICIN domain-containing protein [Glycomyces tritici]MDN3241327.1 RICIN domain-containing protein [Glycomyces tritici]MDN3242189.1 RICIN domain-containing protein [Glycomyces tritici]